MPTPASLDRLRLAWAEAGAGPLTLPMARRLQSVGWMPENVHHVEVLARQARWARDVFPVTDPGRNLTYRVLNLFEAKGRRGLLTRAAALRWFTVIAGAPTRETYSWFCVLMACVPDGPDLFQKEWSAWKGLGAPPPLAYAAGMSVEEATAQRAAGTLIREQMLALAALRGFRMF